jgi:integrase/recombinase XerC
VSEALVRYTGDLVSRSRDWSTLQGDERRRAVQAARDRDTEALWSLTEAYLVTWGKAGARTSPHTRRA